MVVDPATLGVKGTLVDLKGGDAAENLRLLEQLFASGGAGGLADATVLNAAAVLWIAGEAADLKEGVAKARTTLKAGAREHFKAWIAKARALAGA
jgi:anthranilate phosphoribosyltransferase